jgi:hypothetical protein
MSLTLWWFKPLFAVAVAAFVVGNIAIFMHHQQKLGFARGQSELQVKYAKQLADATAAAQAQATLKLNQVEKSHANDIRRANAQIAAGRSARDELGRLRDRLRSAHPASAASAAEAGPGADDTTIYRGLLDSCSVRYEAVAADAGHLADQVIGLQGYVRGLFAGEPNEIEGTPVAAPVGERPRAGITGLVTQPTTEPSGPISAVTAPPTTEVSP